MTACKITEIKIVSLRVKIKTCFTCVFRHLKYKTIVWGKENSKFKKLLIKQKQGIKMYIIDIKKKTLKKHIFLQNDVAMHIGTYIFECLTTLRMNYQNLHLVTQ